MCSGSWAYLVSFQREEFLPFMFKYHLFPLSFVLIYKSSKTKIKFLGTVFQGNKQYLLFIHEHVQSTIQNAACLLFAM